MGQDILAGWYDDPAGGGGWRWWDGAQWTEATVDESAGAGQRATASPTADEPDGPAGGRQRGVARRVVVAMIVGGVLLGGAGVAVGIWVAGGSQPAGPTSQGTAADGATAPGAGAEAELGRNWEKVFSARGQAMWSVARGGPGLVAVGSDDEANAAAVWTSPDGRHWSRVDHDEAVFGGSEEQVMWSVTQGGPGLVAVGSDDEANAAAVWTSPDGRQWSRVDHDEAVFGGDEQWMTSVARGGPGLVAVGVDGKAEAAVWASPDGRQWSRVDHDEAVFGGDGQLMWSVARGGPGLVAVGSDDDAAAVWTSPDGRQWSRVDHDDAVFGGSDWKKMFSVTRGGPGLLAVGCDVGAEAAAVWASPDGRQWSRVEHDEAVFGGDAPLVMRSVVAGEQALVAVGGFEPDCTSGIINDGPAAVWISE